MQEYKKINPGDSLAYLDMVEQAGQEEERRERERALIEEGRWSFYWVPVSYILT